LEATNSRRFKFVVFKGTLKEIAGNCRKLQEIAGNARNFRKLQEIAGRQFEYRWRLTASEYCINTC
jgi:hypothetical protein